MSGLPKLKIRRTWDPTEETRDLEQARYSLFSHGRDMLIIVEGRSIISYEELLQLATQDCYKDKEFLEVVMTPYWPVGG